MENMGAAFNLFDDYNKKDPRNFAWDGIVYPQEYFFATKLYEWVLKLNVDAGEELLLASRCQHIGRWEIPRESYPEGRDAYLKWRKDLAHHHAAVAAELMNQAGYDETQIERVKHIVLKKKLKVDADVQTIENALCLVFLEYQYEDFRKKHEYDPNKMINILRKSLYKMDKEGHKFALTLRFTPDGLRLISLAMKAQ